VPEARAREPQRVARLLGFALDRQRGSHQRWEHPDGRAVTIPVHPSSTIGPPMYYDLLSGLGVSEDEFNRLK